MCWVVDPSTFQYPGYAGLDIFVTPVSKVDLFSTVIIRRTNRIIPFWCPTCIPETTTAYLARDLCNWNESGVLRRIYGDSNYTLASTVQVDSTIDKKEITNTGGILNFATFKSTIKTY